MLFSFSFKHWVGSKVHPSIGQAIPPLLPPPFFYTTAQQSIKAKGLSLEASRSDDPSENGRLQQAGVTVKSCPLVEWTLH